MRPFLTVGADRRTPGSRADPRAGARASAREQPASRQPDRYLADEVPLADVDPARTQDGVRRSAVEMEVRQHEHVEVVGALHVGLGAWPQREGDLAVAR